MSRNIKTQVKPTWIEKYFLKKIEELKKQIKESNFIMKDMKDI